MPNVSACILSYNRAEYLCSAIDSILEQTISPAEILIFDNGSDALVYDRIRPYLERGVVWIGSEANRSSAWNFSRAISGANSEYLFVMHDDDRLCKDFIEQQLYCLSQHPEVGAVTCNGYLIDERGEKNGRLLRHDVVEGGVEFYRTPAAVAIRYASDSCLPFSPAVYRADFAKGQNLREEFGKVLDAVFFCDLARVAPLAYQMRPLYECRVHGEQDSSYFPAVELERLSIYFETEAVGSAVERAELARQLVRQHTSRQLRRLYRSVSPSISVRGLVSELRGLAHRRFSFLAAVSICAAVLKKRVR